jgi:hypothetical protein
MYDYVLEAELDDRIEEKIAEEDPVTFEHITETNNSVIISKKLIVPSIQLNSYLLQYVNLKLELPNIKVGNTSITDGTTLEIDKTLDVPGLRVNGVDFDMT